MNQILNQTFRMVSRMLGWLFEKCWTEPVNSRGPVWTTALWIFIACGVALLQVVPKTHYLVALIFALAWLVMRWENRKPKKLGRPLPYRRRR